MIGQVQHDAGDGRAAGVWTLIGERLIIAEPDGPATIVVPSESVLLLAVDLPLASRAKRMAALPFVIEDRIADPIEAVHVALGVELAPQRYLVGVVRHSLMERWVDQASVAGLGDAAMVPDALTLPTPDAGEWNAVTNDGRVLVRSSDGTGFAVPEALIAQAWSAAGEPRVWNCGAAAIGDLPHEARPDGSFGGLAERLVAPAIDLRQGRYARSGSDGRRRLRRLGYIAAAGVAAHVVIAAADTVMLRAIAERRADEARAAIAQAAPGVPIQGDLRTSVVDMLPAPAAGGSAFLPLISRTSSALAPLSSEVTARAMRFEGNALVFDVDPGEPGLADRLRGALRNGGVAADVAAGADGAIRVTVRA